MKKQKWGEVYEPVPEALDIRLEHTLSHLEEAPQRHFRVRTAMLVLALLIAISGVAYALITSKTAETYGWFYGQEEKENLLAGDIAMPNTSHTIGDVTYTLEEVIYKDGMFYGTMTVRPKEGANVVLMASDHYIWEPAGYILHMGDEEVVPEDAPTYLELAEKQDAKILMASGSIEGFVDDKGELIVAEVGRITLPNTDGTIQETFEFCGDIERAEKYQLRLRAANWEVDREGNHLRAEATTNTFIVDEWEVIVIPDMKGE